MKAWHFVGDTLRDGRPVPKDGELLRFDGKPILCEQGLHASLEPWGALQYAPGETLCLVECGGQIVHGLDKFVCTERTIIVRMDAGPLLRHFARQQALSVVHLWEPPQVVLDFIMGDDAARAAAWAAASNAAWVAARAAASNAAWAAASNAAWAAARAAASNAASNAAWAAARQDFNALVLDSFADWLED